MFLNLTNCHHCKLITLLNITMTLIKTMGMDLKEMKTIFKTKIMVTYMINVQ